MASLGHHTLTNDKHAHILTDICSTLPNIFVLVSILDMFEISECQKENFEMH